MRKGKATKAAKRRVRPAGSLDSVTLTGRWVPDGSGADEASTSPPATPPPRTPRHIEAIAADIRNETERLRDLAARAAAVRKEADDLHAQQEAARQRRSELYNEMDEDHLGRGRDDWQKGI